MAINIPELAGSATQLINDLPILVFYGQIIAYIFLIMFFGSVSFIGFRGYIQTWKRYVIRVAIGTFALLCGIALQNPISEYIPIKGAIAKLFMADLIIASFLCSLVFLVSLFLISKGHDSKKVLEGEIEKLKKRLEKVKKGNPRPFLKRHLVVAGLLILIFMAILFVLYYEGIPNYYSDVLGTMGIDESDIAAITDSMENLADIIPEDISEECLSTLQFAAQNMNEIYESGEAYENLELKNSIETSQESVITIMLRYQKDEDIVVVATLEDGKVCVATENELCSCY